MDSDVDGDKIASPSQDSIELSDYETQFIPKEGDEETLWSVECILAEKGKRYLIRWAGVDDNGKPWADSWVPKHDVTDDLIAEWKIMQAKKKKEKEQKKKNARQKQNESFKLPQSRSSVVSRGSASNRKSSRLSGSNPPNSTSTRSPSVTKGAHENGKKPTRKRKKAVDDDEHPKSVSTSPRKRQKVVLVDVGDSDTDGQDDVVELPNKRKTARSRKEASSETRAGPARRSAESPSRPPDDEMEIVFKREEDEEEIDDGRAHQRSDIYDTIPSPPRQSGTRRKSPRKSGIPQKPPREGDEEAERETVMSASDSERRPSKASMQREAAGAKGKTKYSGNRASVVPSSPVPSPGGRRNDTPEVVVPKRNTEDVSKKSKDRSRSHSSRPSRPDVDDDAISGHHHHRSPSISGADRQNDNLEDFQVAPDFDIHHDEHHPDLSYDFDDPVATVGPHGQATVNGHSSDVDPNDVHESDNGDGEIIPETQVSKKSNSNEDSSQPRVSSIIAEPADSQDHLDGDEASQMTSATGKILKPIPVVTPSRFQPHLQVLKPMRLPRLLNSSPPSADALPSSIETGSSPSKDDLPQPKNPTIADTSANQEVDEIMEFGSSEKSQQIRARGHELAEEHRARTNAANSGGVKNNKRSLGSILAVHVRTDAHADPDALSDTALRDLEEAYVDLNGGDNGPEEARDLNEAIHRGPVHEDLDNEVSVDAGVGKTGEDTEEADVESSLWEGSDRGIDDDDGGERDHGPHTPTSTAPSVGDDEELPPKVNVTPRPLTTHGSHMSLPAQTVASPMRQLDSSMSLLHLKSEEILVLKAQLSDSREERNRLQEKLTKLEADNEWLARERDKAAANAASDDMDVQIEQNALHVEAEAAWTKERQGLLAEINLLKIARDETQDERNLFKDQYSRASSFVTEIQQENQELHARVTIAEKQVAVGLDLVRSDFGVRVRKLEEELQKARAVLHLFKERDRRTDDVIRKKAAMEPHLLAQIASLKDDATIARTDMNGVLRQRNDLIVKIAQMRDELERSRELHAATMVDRRQLKVQLERSSARERNVMKELHVTPMDDLDAEGELEDPGEELVYFCSWAINDNCDRCGEVFSSRQDLQDHLFLSGHI
ncbi:hypothetical protein BD410DRAFT_793053 [Rickenella mellea]|uniref:C2H2-type domain-containing protein n=1 Tax=Rickenella mellea TaxID=50990 RepID=A0A4Y7PTD6_9AGAM|nr:hypothetical protein BD410DRAFT_793053 [Rickenella mellea]